MEIWKDVKGFEDYYEVSNLGNVRRKDSLYVLKQLNHKKGYLRVYLSVNSKKKGRAVHRIVAEAFIENPENKETVNHIDLNKKNNKVDNLEWMTNKENIQHAFKNGVYRERDKTTIRNLGKYAGY